MYGSLLFVVVDAQSSDAGTIACRIPSRNIELTRNLTVLGRLYFSHITTSHIATSS